MRLKRVTGFLAALLLLMSPACAWSSPTPAAPAASAPITHAIPAPLSQKPHVLDRDDLAAWLDGYLPYALERGDVAGAVVVIVKDGKVLLQKGYGFADVATHRPFDPQTTLVRPGSVSKLITWTAVMQLVEQHRIDLDKDVNTYLDFKIPPFDGQPVTMRNLMTHTPGFQDTFKDIVSFNPKGPPPLAEYLKRNLPVRVYPPGKVPAYSNYGVALAGYIVERVSGQRFDDYIEQHIFAPLGMNHSTFAQPLPVAFRPDMAKGYDRASEPPSPYEMFAIAPAGSAALTGADMAKFMIAHLQDGTYDGHRILQPATARMMHNTPWTAISPSVDRMLLGFYEFDRNGHRIIGHDGDSLKFHSVLQLFLDDHVGLFVSLNSIGRDGAARAIREGLINEFADRYFPGPLPSSDVRAVVAKAHAVLLAGGYDGSAQGPQAIPTNFLSLADLFQQNVVTADSSGNVFASSVLKPNGQPARFKEIAPFVWQAVEGGARLAAKVKDGRVTMWGVDGSSPYEAFMPTPIWRDARWLLPLLGFSIVALLLSAIAWPIGALVRWRYGVSHSLQRSTQWMRIGVGAAGALMVSWLMTVTAMLTTFSVSSALDPWIMILHILSVIIFPLAVLISFWDMWTTSKIAGARSALAWIGSGILTLSCLTVFWVALVFHLIGFGVAF